MSNEPSDVVGFERLPTDALVYVLMGPSGVGKSTLAHALVSRNGRGKYDFVLNQAWRTRPKRTTDGDENIHCSESEFAAAETAGKFLFTMQTYADTTGTLIPKQLPINTFWLHIYLPENAATFKRFYPNTRLVEIMPPEVDVLKDRILGRDPSIATGELQQRVAAAGLELERGKAMADLIFVNDGPIEIAKQNFERLIADDITAMYGKV